MCTPWKGNICFKATGMECNRQNMVIWNLISSNQSLIDSLCFSAGRCLRDSRWRSSRSVKDFEGCLCLRISEHLGQIPKAVTGAACPTLAQPQLTEMDSPEWNETHKASCTPHRRLYQTKINGRQHSLCAPKLQGQIQYLGGVGVIDRLRLCMCKSRLL